MTPEQQRIAIAEVCGWERGYTGATQWINDPYGIRVAWSSMREVADAALPDYLNDLNAMHKAVFTLSETQRCAFQQKLGEIAERMSICFCECTASLWAEAFLKSLGKWTED